MATIEIQAIEVDEQGELFLKPKLPPDRNYRFIWRDASSVRWDDDSRSLYCLPIKGFDHLKYALQIFCAVKSECRDDLVISTDTLLTGLPEDFRQRYQDETDAIRSRFPT